MKIDLLRKKLKNGQFSSRCASEFGVSPQLLHYYWKVGRIERVSHGVYLFPDRANYDLISSIKDHLAIFPHAVIGHQTALALYDLTENPVSMIDLIVPHSNVPKRKMDGVVFHVCKDNLYRIEVHMLQGVPVTSLERVIIDLLRDNISMSFVLKVMSLAKKKGVVISLSKIKRMSEAFRVKQKVTFLIEAFTY